MQNEAALDQTWNCTIVACKRQGPVEESSKKAAARVILAVFGEAHNLPVVRPKRALQGRRTSLKGTKHTLVRQQGPAARQAAPHSGPNGSPEVDDESWMNSPVAPNNDIPEVPTAWPADHPTRRHIVSVLHAGAYGRFHKAIAPLEAIIQLDKFKLPRLIVVGSQHRGKSSLLESITKCPIFPRGNVALETTTRAPVCLSMKHVKSDSERCIEVIFNPANGQRIHERLEREEQIIGVVQQIMDSIPQDRIVDDEVTVRICSPKMTTIEFVDLPGIVEDPPAKKEQTTRLVQKYLQEKSNLVLCVEEATCGCLDSCQAIFHIKQAGRAAQTIMVLTKADTVAAENQRKQLWRRIKGQTNEATGFAGMVAVINREHHIDRMYWEVDPDQLEEVTFENKVLSKLPEMPQQFRRLSPAVKNNLTVSNLVAQVEFMYREYIINEWQAVAQGMLQPKVQQAEQALHILGPKPEDLSVSMVMQEIWMQLDFGLMTRRLGDETLRADWSIYTNSSHTQRLRDLGNSLDDFGQMTLSNIEQLKTASTTALCSIEGWLDEAAYLKIIQREVSRIFGQVTAMRLNRFQSLKQEIVHRALKHAVDTQRIKAELMADLRPIAAMLRLNFTKLRSGLGCLQDMEQAAHTAIVQEVFLPLKNGGFVKCVPDSFPLVESPAAHERRLKATEERDNLKHALDVINNIHVQVDQAPASPAG